MPSELDPLWLAAYETAGRLIGSSLLNVPIYGDYSLDGTAVENDCTTPAHTRDTLTILFCGAIAKFLYQSGGSEISDWTSIGAEAMAQLKVSDTLSADLHKAAAQDKASKFMNSDGVKMRVDKLAEDLYMGAPVDTTHPSLQFTVPAEMAARRASQRGVAMVMTTDLTGSPL